MFSIRKSTTTAILALFLAGCACMEPQAQSGKPDPFNPKVWVVDGKIVVDQEPILLPKGAPGAEVTFSFRLEPTAAHDFPANGWRMRELAEGIHYTVVNGEVLLEKGEHTGSHPGRVLRNARYQTASNGGA